MLSLRKLDYLQYSQGDNRSQVTAELWCDTESDLPAADGIDGYLLMMGSIAYVINSGLLYVMNSQGSWVSTDGVSLS